MDTSATSLEHGLTYECHQYGEHSLQKLAVWRFQDRPAQPSGYWIIYIHGGAWRDPLKRADDFLTSIKAVTSSGQETISSIQGFVSIDYRLSPHPEFPQDPSTTKSSDLRDAKHPDHIQDIRSAINYAQAKYQFSDNYILMGHSAGGTLAHQLLMSNSVLAGQPRKEVTFPTAIVSISGIYDIENIDVRHNGDYSGFISAAFGDDKAEWASASPTRFGASFKESWSNGKLMILAWSPEDSLVDEPEIDDMNVKLRHDGLNVELVKDLHGDHDFVWEDGKQVARLISLALPIPRVIST